MKKFLCLCLIIINTLCFASCSKSFYYDYESMKEDVVYVEIIDIFQFNPNERFDLVKDIYDEEKDGLLLDLSKIEFTYSMGPPNTSPEGICLKLYYKNNDYGFINFNTSIRFNNEGKRIAEKKLDCPTSEFEKLVSKFVDKQMK